MYESPIDIIHGELEMQLEGEIMKAVRRVGVNVDKEELIRTLKYDRAQYEKGYEDGRNACKWIPCSERLPKNRDWCLAMFKEPDTGFIGVPYIADYLMGKHTAYTTDEGWIIAHCTDTESESADYYKKLVCVAWMPLPEPYRGE